MLKLLSITKQHLFFLLSSEKRRTHNQWRILLCTFIEGQGHTQYAFLRQLVSFISILRKIWQTGKCRQDCGSCMWEMERNRCYVYIWNLIKSTENDKLTKLLKALICLIYNLFVLLYLESLKYSKAKTCKHSNQTISLYFQSNFFTLLPSSKQRPQ